MKVKIIFPNYLHLKSNEVGVNPGSIQDAFNEVNEKHAECGKVLFDEKGDLKKNLFFVKNDEIITSNCIENEHLKEGDKLMIVMQFAGG